MTIKRETAKRPTPIPVMESGLADAARQRESRYNAAEYVFGAAPSRFLARELARFRALIDLIARKPEGAS